jgi:hypothetical protein
MFDKYGLNPLTEVSVNCVSQYQFFSYHWCFKFIYLKLKEHILKLKRGTSCVLFIGQLVQASFPERYFYDDNMDNITQVQLDRLYGYHFSLWAIRIPIT